VPRAAANLGWRDRLGTVRARLGIARNRYKINPGLYCVGKPTVTSPVLVTANYKLSFDALRSELSTVDAWILVLDTRGINVWCAAGKGTFSAEEIALQIKRARLAEIVSTRELILPQLAAPGVASPQLMKECGFKGIFGPIRASDLPRFLTQDKKADEEMRAVTFHLAERLVLVPVELSLVLRVFLLISLGLLVLSGLGPDFYSLSAAIGRGMTAVGATILALLAGAFLTPALLPWIPGRQFWLKGLLVGGLAGLAFVGLSVSNSRLEAAGLWCWISAAASYMAMNFTGATPYTSLSGVEKEMRRGLPVQIGGTALALAMWLAAPFLS